MNFLLINQVSPLNLLLLGIIIILLILIVVDHLPKFKRLRKNISNINGLLKEKESIINGLNTENALLNDNYDELISRYNIKNCKIYNFLNLIKSITHNKKDCHIVAVSENGQTYFSFEVKKEAGIIVTRKVNGKNEKVSAKLGFIEGKTLYVLDGDIDTALDINNIEE